MVERFDTLRTGLIRSGDQLADTLAVATKQLERLGEMHAAGPPQQHVTVQHSVPRVMLDVVRGQFHLMQEWMKPLLEGTVGQNREFSELRGQVESLLRGYARLQADLEAASSPVADRTVSASPSDQAFSDPTLFPEEPA